MAGRRGARDGAMATALTRADGERAAIVMGPRCPIVERRLRPALLLYRLARLADAWGTAGAAPGVHPHLRQRAGAMGREPPHPAHPETRGTAAASQHLQWGMLFTTLTACWWMASGFITGYSQGGMFPTYLQKEVGLSPAFVTLPVMLQSLMFFSVQLLLGLGGRP